MPISGNLWQEWEQAFLFLILASGLGSIVPTIMNTCNLKHVASCVLPISTGSGIIQPRSTITLRDRCRRLPLTQFCSATADKGYTHVTGICTAPVRHMVGSAGPMPPCAPIEDKHPRISSFPPQHVGLPLHQAVTDYLSIIARRAGRSMRMSACLSAASST